MASAAAFLAQSQARRCHDPDPNGQTPRVLVVAGASNACVAINGVTQEAAHCAFIGHLASMTGTLAIEAPTRSLPMAVRPGILASTTSAPT
jgi:hypothetical protein